MLEFRSPRITTTSVIQTRACRQIGDSQLACTFPLKEAGEGDLMTIGCFSS